MDIGDNIRHKKVGTVAIIKSHDSLRMNGNLIEGYKVYIPKERKSCLLPFANLEDWEKI